MAPYPTYQAACTPTQAFLTACKIWLIVSGCYFVKLIRTEDAIRQYENLLSCRLPTAYTCFSLLLLPLYSSLEAAGVRAGGL